MGLRTNPTQRQRRLGYELRRLRDACGLSAAQAGAFAGLGSPHLGHIEAGRTAIPEAKLRALASAYGCQSKPLVDALVEMGASTGRGWWRDYRKYSLDQRALDLAELEASTPVHRSFQWMYVPGLLQTPEYMRALFEGGEPDASPESRDAYAEFRLRRQQILTEPSPPTLHAVLHEAALHMRFVTEKVMRQQIEHLVELSRLPHVHIQILPFKADVYPAPFSTPFVIYETEVPELSTVYVEHPVASPFISDRDHLAQFSTCFERLSSVALPSIATGPQPEFQARKDSLGLIQHLLYSL